MKLRTENITKESCRILLALTAFTVPVYLVIALTEQNPLILIMVQAVLGLNVLVYLLRLAYRIWKFSRLNYLTRH